MFGGKIREGGDGAGPGHDPRVEEVGLVDREEEDGDQQERDVGRGKETRKHHTDW